MAAQVLTANRLIDGDVVYWRAGAWVEALAQAEVFAGEPEAEAAVAAAKRCVEENVVVNPYLFELKGDRPAKEREIIRALGPSVREDVGKQAADLPSGFAAPQLRRDKQGGGERDDDVSI
jgi:sulfite reductase (NADPH) hemoprotein beta-component